MKRDDGVRASYCCAEKADAVFDGGRFGYKLDCPEYIENGKPVLR